MPAAQGYIGRNPADSSTVIARQSFSPTGIQTDFTFAAGYSVGYVDLYLNGARLIEGQDFTATDGSTVGLTTNAVNGDVLEVVAFKAFNVASVTTAGGDFTVGNNLTVSGTSEFTGAITATGGVVGDVTGDVTGDATGLSGTPDLTIRNITGVAATFTGILSYDDVVNVDSIGIITARSIVSIADSIIHTGDTDTSIRFPAAGTFTINTDGSEKVRVTSDGEALIGATSARAVEWSPGNGGTPKLQVEGNAGSSSQILITDTRTDGRNSQLAFAKTRDGSIVQDDDILGSIGFFGDDGSDTRTWGGRITCEVDGTPGGNDMPGRLAFFTTADGASTPTERLRITSQGRIGIGTAEPDRLLVVAGSDPIIRSENTDSGNDYAEFKQLSGALYIDSRNDSSDGTIIFRGVGGGSATEKLRITSGGVVIVNGTAAGSNAKFEVQSTTGSISSATLRVTAEKTSTGAINTGSSILLAGHDGGNSRDFASLFAGKENGTGSNHDAYLAFGTRSNGSALAERLRIDSSGRLLVGLTGNVDGSSTQINFSATLNRGSNATAADANIGVLKFADLRSNSAYGEIRCQSDGTPGTDDYPGRITFSTTADGASSVTERARIDSSGRVLIGTTSLIDSSTASNFQIASSSGPRICIARNNTTVTGGNLMGAIDFYGNDSDGTYEICGRMILEADGTHTTDAKPTRMAFYTTPSGSDTATERVRITSSGQFNVGSGSFVVESDGDISTNVRGHGHIELDSTGTFSTPKVKLYSNTGNAEFAGTIEDSIGPVRRLGITNHNASTLTLTASHAGNLIREATNSANITVPSGVFTAGDMITIFNVSSGDNTITQGSSVTLYNTADAATGNRTLGAKGVCTIACTASNEFIISGSNLS